MKDRSKTMSKDTWRDPTRSLNRIKHIEKLLSTLFINYRKRLLKELTPPVQNPLMQKEPLTQTAPKWHAGMDISHFFERLEDLSMEELLAPANHILEKEIPDAFTHGTKYADLHIKATMGIKLGAPLEARQAAWKKIGDMVTASQGEFKGVTDATNQQIRRAVSDGMINESSLSDVSQAIQDATEGIGEARARTIARTETMKAINTGTVDRYAQAGIEQVEFLASLDERVCPECEELDGKIFPIDEAPEVPVHPNCVHPDTIVGKEGIISGFKVWYDGMMIEILLSNGGRLTVTPNHMLLTDRGFAAADLLCEGDKIFYCTNFKREISNDPDNNNMPSRIEDVIKSFAMSGSVITKTMPISPEDFHGDGRFCNGNVDIIYPNCFLRDTNQPSLLKQTFTNDLNPAGKSQIPLFSNSSLSQFLNSAALATNSSMSSIRESAPFFRGRLRHTEQHSIMSSSRSDTKQLQSTNHGFSMDTENLMDLFNRFSSIVELQDVVAVKVVMYTGHIYDLQTLSTLYIGNGLIISNCRCTLIAHVDTGEELEQKREPIAQKADPEQITGQGRIL